MYLFKRESSLKKYLAFQRSFGNTIGFAPTMGALHQGHIALIEQSKKESDCTVCSIFVNPTQFNKADDLALYPRTPAKDVALLGKVGCDVLFFPEVTDIYPENGIATIPVELGDLANVMEGAHRPGHFEGVVQVVQRLLQIVNPDQLFMGEKDFQQLTIIRTMVEQLALDTEVVGVPIIRETDGLAMSSRNVRLNQEERQSAPKIYAILQQAKAMIGQSSLKEIKAFAMDQLTKAGFKPEYFEIVDRFSLQPLQSVEGAKGVVACTAVWLGKVRLIDNLVLI
jgi:pantoate--beta-alanine ligase